MKKRILTIVIVLQLSLQLLTPAFALTSQIYDPLAMLDMLNENQITPNVDLPTSDTQLNMPQLPNGMISPQAHNKPSELVTGPQETTKYQSIINSATGKLDLESYDISIDALGFDLKLARFKSDDIGAFGNGWDLNFYTELKMYSAYDIGEVRIDGIKRAFKFVKDLEDGDITSYDDDPMVNYKLHEGHYELAAGDSLVRISKTEYVVTTKKGEKLTYYGYKAPWRTNGHVLEGKLLKREDAYGNQITYEYDESGRLTALVNGQQRITITYDSNGYISKMTGPLNLEVFYTYTNGYLTSVKATDREIASYGYTSGKLTEISQNGLTQKFTYNNDKISSVSINDNTIYTYTYDGNNTTITDANGGVRINIR